MTLPANTAPAQGGDDPVRFVCPMCRHRLAPRGEGHDCRRCLRHFPVRDGLHCFFVDPDPGAGAGMRGYTEMFRSIDTAASYARSFQAVPRKRWRTRRELTVLADLLGKDPGPSVLNIPCGGGRLSQPLHSERGMLLEADSSPGQLTLNRRRFGDNGRRIWLTASAFVIPLPDDAVDTVVCARLSHHLRDAGERDALLDELLRVARRRVVFSFRNRVSLPAWSRRLRGRAVHPTSMTIAEVDAAAERRGARVARWRSVSNLGARHSYALIIKHA